MAVRKATVGGVLSGFVLAALLVAFFNPPEPGVISGEFEYVQRVVDGDTLVLGTGERVRLIGVDTPESVRPNTPVQRFAREAADFTRRMVEGKRVRLEYDQANAANGHKDNCGYRLAWVVIRGRRAPLPVNARRKSRNAKNLVT